MLLILLFLLFAPTASLDERLAKWKPVQMPYHSEGQTARERQLVEKLVDASRYMESIYWRQSDPEGLQLLRTTTDPKIRRLLVIHGGRFDLLDENAPFTSTEPMSPGRGIYPKGITREQIEQYVKAHPAEKDG